MRRSSLHARQPGAEGSGGPRRRDQIPIPTVTSGRGPADRLRQDLELDSLDFLRVLETIAARTGVDIPEGAYGEVRTVGGVVGYLAARG